MPIKILNYYVVAPNSGDAPVFLLKYILKNLNTQTPKAALIIDKSILELLEITFSTPLKIITNGKSQIISSVNEGDREDRFQKALNKVNLNHGETLG